MKIPTDSKMNFDYSVSTEDRFALRTWLEQLLKGINYNDKELYLSRLGENLSVEGFSEQIMDRETYVMFLSHRAQEKIARVIRFPDLEIKFKHYLYHLSGRYEEFEDGILSYEGTLELVIVKENETFKLVSLKFFPRLRLTKYENPEL